MSFIHSVIVSTFMDFTTSPPICISIHPNFTLNNWTAKIFVNENPKHLAPLSTQNAFAEIISGLV